MPDPLEFHFYLGSPALNFANTLGYRGSEPVERLPAPHDLGRWIRAAGLGPPPIEPTPAEHRAALRLREAIYRIGHAFVHGQRPKRADVEELNAVAAAHRPLPQLDPSRLKVTLASKAPVGAALAAVAEDAIRVFGSEERERLGICEAATCHALVLGNARGPYRRWCSMATCGNRAKVAAFRRRNADR